MQTEINSMTTDELKNFIHEAVRDAIDDYIEDIIGSLSNNYLYSIQEARQDYKKGKYTDMQNLINE